MTKETVRIIPWSWEVIRNGCFLGSFTGNPMQGYSARVDEHYVTFTSKIKAAQAIVDYCRAKGYFKGEQ